ncbi:MAG: DNA translocase FtsK [Clostridia bacterium]|nr:DNA translocase FtsK [Clostridia bacterium]
MATRKRIPAKDAKKQKTTISQELWAVICIAVGIIMALCLYTNARTSPLGYAFHTLTLGLMGIVGYVLPLYIQVLGVHLLVQQSFAPYRRGYVLTFLFLLLVSALVHLFTGTLEWDFAAYYAMHFGGGVFGGLLATFLYKLSGRAISCVILIGLMVPIIMIVFGISLRNLIESLRACRPAKKEKPAKEGPKEPVFQPEKKVKNEVIAPMPEPTAPTEAEEPFDFDSIKIFTHDQLSLENAGGDNPAPSAATEEAAAPKAPIDAPKASAEAEDEAEKAIAVADIEAEMTQNQPPREYIYPSLDLLEQHKSKAAAPLEDLRESAKKLVETLKSFGVEAKVLEVTRGPSVTRFELQPSAGVKVSKIVNLADDIALNLAAFGVRIEAPIPGKAAVGIEIPNKNIATVSLREVLESAEFRDFPSKTAFALGKDISGKTNVADVAKMPHLLIAGATGSGKSVCINSLISSLIYKASPDEVRLLMIDPKVVELGVYNGIPHLMIPVVTEPRKAAGALNWAVTEMLRRYKLFAECNVREISHYNELMKEEGCKTIEKIVIIVDELADLMMAAPHEVEDAICRLAQMGRAAGMHLVIATQRPSVDVITGLIKANVPSRIAFAVSSQIDSRTILDMMGAEKLLGRGDMLYLPFGAAKPVRLQGAFVSDAEVERIVEFVKGDAEVEYNVDILERLESEDRPEEEDAGDSDPLLTQAIELVVDSGQASVSMIQRRFKVGYSRAGRIIDQMELRGVIGPHEGSKPRQVLLTKQQFYEMQMQADE